jgi:hypothetical protein
MQTYWEAIKDWLDKDNLVGSRKFPEPWSTGNGLLETGIALTIGMKLSGNLDVEVLKRIQSGIDACLVRDEKGNIIRGLFNKNPGRKDEITHDCIIGVVAGSRASGMQFHYDVALFGTVHGWEFCNTGRPYFTAYSKPWHVAFYKFAAGVRPAAYEEILLAAQLIFSAFKSNVSGLRLSWLMMSTVSKSSTLMEMVSHLFFWQMKKRFKDLSGLMQQYYGNAEHPFVQYTKELI